MTEYRVRINGIETEARYSDRAVEEIFLPLLRKLTEMQNRAGKRILVMLAAPPGAGKTTLLTLLEKLSREHGEIGRIQTIGMDGFHRPQDYLLSHEVTREGQRIPMVRIKGAPVTFDLQGLTERVRRVAAGENCPWPLYDRLLHNPVDNGLTVEEKIVILEGNYLLLEEEGWRDLSAFADFTISLRAPENLLRKRLIDRRIRTGVEKDAAVRFVDFSDMPNARLCLEKTMPARLMLELDEGEDWRVCTSCPGI